MRAMQQAIQDKIEGKDTEFRLVAIADITDEENKNE
jgi:hypothetical protein